MQLASWVDELTGRLVRPRSAGMPLSRCVAVLPSTLAWLGRSWATDLQDPATAASEEPGPPGAPHLDREHVNPSFLPLYLVSGSERLCLDPHSPGRSHVSGIHILSDGSQPKHPSIPGRPGGRALTPIQRARRAATSALATWSEERLSQLLEFPGSGGRPVLVEIAPDHSDPVTRGARGRDVVTKTEERLERVLGSIGPTVSGIVSELREVSSWPDDIEVEFSIGISADANAIIARTGGEANFRVLLRWARKEP